MTYLEALRRKLGVETIDETLDALWINDEKRGNKCPAYFGLEAATGECPHDACNTCMTCWMREYPDPVVHEEVETIYPCTVQILRNPETGEESVGWFRGQMDG